MEKKTEGIFVEERSDIRGNYLVATGCEAGGYREEMLKNSQIPGLLTVTGQDFDGRHELWYEIGGLHPLRMKFSQNAPGTGEITHLMQQIEELAVKLEEYLLEPGEVGMELSWIFEGEDGRYLFLYLPGYAKTSSGGVCRLLEELMEYVDYKNHRTVSFLYLLHAGSRQQTSSTFALRSLCEEILKAAQTEEEAREADDFFAEFEEEKERETRNVSANRKRIRKLTTGAKREREENGEMEANWKRGIKEKEEGKQEEKWMEKDGREKTKEKRAEKKGKIGKFKNLLQRFQGYIKAEREENSALEDEDYALEPEADRQSRTACVREHEAYEEYEQDHPGADTVLLSGEELSETVLLTGNPDTMLLQKEYCCLEPQEEGRESICLTAYPFCIGKERSCDYVLKDPVISRRHAKILKEGTRYFLMDTRSLNGTYLNGKRLAANEKTEIKKEDRIDFADICFIFTCCKS